MLDRYYKVQFSPKKYTWNGLKEDVFIKKSMNEEERQKFKELKEEAKQNNYERTTERKQSFFWRVKNNKIMKWYINNKC